MTQQVKAAAVWLTVVAICLAAGQLTASAQTIPAGVRYKKAPDALNQKAKAILEAALAAKPEEVKPDELFGSVVLCGPMLWETLKPNAGPVLQNAKPATVVIPVQPKPVVKEAKRAITTEEKSALWLAFSQYLKRDKAYTVRPANAAELSYYWATIPYDIEEPLYVIDLGAAQVIAHFIVKEEVPRLFLLDLVTDLSKLSPPVPTNLLEGRVTYTLPAEWWQRGLQSEEKLVQLRLGLPAEGYSANEQRPAAMIVAGLSSQVTLKDFSGLEAQTYAQQGYTARVVKDVAEGTEWRTLAFALTDKSGNQLLALSRYGVARGVVVRFTMYLPQSSPVARAALARQVADFNQVCHTLKIDGQNAGSSEIKPDDFEKGPGGT